MVAYRYVILGGGIAAGYAIRELVEAGIQPGEGCIISADNALPYERPTLSKAYLAGKKSRESILINPPEFYDQNGIDVHLDTRISRADLGAHLLETGDGSTFEYDKLLIVTGSRPNKITLPHADLPGIYYLRSLAHAQQLREQAQKGGKAVIIGGGYIGMEVGATLASTGVDVTLVYRDNRLMERLFTPPMSGFFEDCYHSKGVKLISQSEAAAFLGHDHVTGVALLSGEHVPADFVVVGVGASPNIGLFEGSELNLDHGGIVVNKYLETNVAGIYAAGDIANYYDVLFQKQRRIEHWDNAVTQGKHAAQIMIGTTHKEYMHVPYFFSDIFDLSYDFWGETETADQVIYRGDIESGHFSVWWLSGEQVVGALVMNSRPDDERKLAPEWIRFKGRPNPLMLQDEAVSLAEIDRDIV